MKKIKFSPINSYYSYKQNKNKHTQSLFIMIVCSIFLLGASLSGKVKEDFFELMGEDIPKQIPESVYLETGTIGYDFFNAPIQVRGIYIPSRQVENIEEYIQMAKETDVNSFVMDVKNDYGYLTFETDNEVLINAGCVLAVPSVPSMRAAIIRCYEEGIYPIARVVAFKDNVMTQRNPECAVKAIDGKTYFTRSEEAWLDPYNKENWSYILEVCKEAARLGFKEIQLDYIRFHESMDAERVVLEGNTSKTEIIAQFTKYICENLHELDVYVSADVFGATLLSDIDANIVGQDVKEMSKYLDYISPMVYPSHYGNGVFGIEYPHLNAYDIIYKSMKLGINRISDSGETSAVIRPWLQDFTMSRLKPYLEYGPEEIKAQINGTYDAGLEEWLFWNAAGNYTIDGLR